CARDAGLGYSGYSFW
nr:immunoglobulin heavy chain junction region [Macaca mulatta]MOW96186.1 immunoglobulin heavy chain junction region [Macaca mulatta]MOW96748.1 immunoglobulin heavy chain junction region [Macaca mulatta]MOW97299.1 immunoglobulin heavy chain junction region [Macaca mulatta]MOW97550.1 immunoglobulin heavy chain junction region [Macaca mulatta]